MNKIKRHYLFLTSILVLVSIGSTYYVTVSTVAQQGTATAPQMGTANNEYQTGATLWMQHSAENRALAYQAFNLAKMMLDRDFWLNRRNKQRRAIVVDADETVIDNTLKQAWDIKYRQTFTNENWLAWCKREEATAIPGAVEFLTYAHKRGVRIFYVTNRNVGEEKTATINNLKKLGFPDVSDETVMCRSKETGSSKESRRQAIMAKHRIVLLMGDNLNDLAKEFERKSTDDRKKEVDTVKNLFGTKYIVLPNPMYGEWENAIYNYERLTEEQKAACRNESLKSF
jgi:5'-nucleotidase (lipoprotein e(P4) family)